MTDDLTTRLWDLAKAENLRLVAAIDKRKCEALESQFNEADE